MANRRFSDCVYFYFQWRGTGALANISLTFVFLIIYSIGTAAHVFFDGHVYFYRSFIQFLPMKQQK